MVKIILTLIFFTIIALVSCSRNSSHSIAIPITSLPEKTTPTPTSNRHFGRKVFIEKSCNVCHSLNQGEQGTGQSLDHLQATMSENYSFAKFVNAIHRPKKIMPSYKGLVSKKELCCLYSFLTKGKEVEGCVKCEEVLVDWCGT